MGEYTALAALSVVLVVLYERLWLRSGVFRDRRYWIAMAVCYAFMVPVNGWYTKLSAPIVRYDPEQITGLRVPWDIPVEDFVFGFSLLTLVLARWIALGTRRDGAGGIGATDDGAGRIGAPGGDEAAAGTTDATDGTDATGVAGATDATGVAGGTDVTGVAGATGPIEGTDG